MIILSLLDQDAYKFGMAQVVFHQFPSAHVEYKFQDRGNKKLGFLADKVRESVLCLGHLSFTKKEIDYLRTVRYLKPSFIEFLETLKLNPSREVVVSRVGDNLDIRVKGLWRTVIFYEVMILAIVNELYFDSISDKKNDRAIGLTNLRDKIAFIKKNIDPACISRKNPFIFSNFGTRRRFSREWAFEIDEILSKESDIGFIGTSNVYNAMTLNVKMIGTMAHEFIQAMQAFTNVTNSQRMALQCWENEYRGDLGIALSDCLGMKMFLKDFDPYFAKLFDGCRHDSGDPYQWTLDLLDHYEKLGIDPNTKTAVYSDGLDFNLAIELWKAFGNRIKTAFGVGTNLTNDCGYEPLKIVMKMVRCNDLPVAKISDSEGKGMCEDENYLRYLKSAIAGRVSK